LGKNIGYRDTVAVLGGTRVAVRVTTASTGRRSAAQAELLKQLRLIDELDLMHLNGKKHYYEAKTNIDQHGSGKRLADGPRRVGGLHGASRPKKPRGASGEKRRVKCWNPDEDSSAIEAFKRAAAPVRGLRFHDLRHQAITGLAGGGASEVRLMGSGSSRLT
jgi:hypothetical protein